MRRKIIGVAAGLLLLGACGSSSSKSEGASTASSATTVAVATTAKVAQTTVAGTAVPTDETLETIGPDDTDPAADTTPLDTSAPVDTSFTGEGSGDFCALIKEYTDDPALDSLFGSAAGSDPAKSKADFAKLLSLMGNLKDKAPDEIKADVTLMTDAFGKIGAAFEKYGWDVAKVGQAAATDPELQALFTQDTADMGAAGTRLDAYGTNVCHLAS